MRTTIELPDPLYRQAKAVAALRGRKLKDLVEEGLRLAIAKLQEEPAMPTLAEPMRPAQGIVESGFPDLGSNPDHLIGFGRDASHRR